MYVCDDMSANYQDELNKILYGEDDGMKTSNGFTLFENGQEFGQWLAKQSVTRSITRLQVHHMAMPDYACWQQDINRWGKANGQ